MSGRASTDYHLELRELISLSVSGSYLSSIVVDAHVNGSSIFQVVRRCLDEISSRRQLAEDLPSARYYAALLRLAYLLLSDPKTEHDRQVGGMVTTLAMFFTYCPQHARRAVQAGGARAAPESVPGPSSGASQGGGDRGTYRPPHLRGLSSGTRGVSSSVGGGSDDDTWRTGEAASWRKGSGRDGASGSGRDGVGGLSSDSELSDSDGGAGGDRDKSKSAKARLGALLCLQAIARADPKSLHASWGLLLPTRDVLQPRPHQPSLLTPLLFDPSPKVRLAAATAVVLMLDGPSKAYLQAAELKPASRSSPFSSLSGTLGEIAVQLHTGLVHLLRTEADGSILSAVLKALSLLVAATPYHRVLVDLLPGVLRAILHRFGNLSSSPTTSASPTASPPLAASAIACIGAALAATPPSPAVAQLLEAHSVVGVQAPSSITRDLIACTLPSVAAPVAIEAFQALRAAAQHYPAAMSPHWLALSSAIASVLRGEGAPLSVPTERGPVKQSPRRKSSSGGSSPRHGGQLLAAQGPAGGGGLDEKLAQSAVKLMDELLRAASGFRESVDEGAAEDPHAGSPFPTNQTSRPSPDTASSAPAVSTSGATDADRAPAGSTSGAADADRAPAGSDATAEGLREWTDALDCHLPMALSHPSAMVRGAGVTCFAGITSEVMQAFPDDRQNRILSHVVGAVGYHEAPTVRSAACRALGVMVAYPPIINRQERLRVVCDALTSATSPSMPSVQVRIVGAWALANMCAAMRRATESTSSLGLPAGEGDLALIASCMLRAAADGDKVRANAVRGLGHLASFTRFDFPRPALTRSVGGPAPLTVAPPAACWLESLVRTLISTLTTGNAKVQWNVCHAAACLFSNPTASRSTAAWAAPLYEALLPLLRNSPNFKIRIHAASALAAPSSRNAYGGMFEEIVCGLANALEGLDAAHGESPTDFKYKPALEQQLRSALASVKAMASPEELPRLSHQLSRLLV